MNRFTRFLIGSAALCAAIGSQAATFVGSRSDFRDETIYFAMTTRFYDGDPTNNTYCWDGVLNQNDPEWRGDFKGLIDKLDYIKALGFTAVWITPVVENASGLDYHGYHAFDFSKVDPRYESTDCKFQDLIDAAHSRGMKVVLDIVLQHTGNFGENFLCPMFVKDYSANLSNLRKSLKLHPNSVLPANYDFDASNAYSLRIAALKNEGGGNGDSRNHYHHVANEWNWDDPSRWWGQIAGDCVDLNTENPEVTNYLVDCYGKFIAMGVDGFRIDTAGHISRLTFNNAFIPRFQELAERYKSRRNGGDFFMFGEVCARDRNVTYRNHVGCSPYWYTWKETKNYPWDYSEDSWSKIVVKTGERGNHVNATSVTQQGNDYLADVNSSTPTSTNAFLNGNAYHTPDRSQYSGLSVIDFPMHWNFRTTGEAWGIRSGDKYYNDASYNVMYVDSHDYAPDGAPESKRFAGSQTTWASNLDLMFTFRGIPCIYYGSEIEFKKGCTIDEGAALALKNSGRAYFGGFIEGSVDVADFADYRNATGNMAVSLKHPLSLHIQRLNKIRAAIPALRKGQYSTSGCSGNIAFKRRYTDSTTDSYVLVTIGGNATFTGVENGTYTDAITGDVKKVTDGKLSATCSGAANMRIYVLSTAKTPAPGKIGTDGAYLYATSPVNVAQGSYPQETEPLDTQTKRDNGAPEFEEPENPITPAMAEGEQAAFFHDPGNAWGTVIKAWVWSPTKNFTGGSWPGQNAQYLGNGYWKWTYSSTDKIPDNAQIIFNSGSDANKTADMKWVNGGVYVAGSTVPERVIEGAGEIVGPDPEEPDEVDWVFYFLNSRGWDKVFCYLWDDGHPDGLKQHTGSWPGRQVTETVSADELSRAGETYHRFILPNTAMYHPQIIFNGGEGKEQTTDLEAVNGGVYTPDGFSHGIVSQIQPVIDNVPMNVEVIGGVLTITSPTEALVPVVRLDGTYRTIHVYPGVNRYSDLARGFYVVGGTKVIL